MKTSKNRRFAKYSLPTGQALHKKITLSLSQLLSRKSNDPSVAPLCISALSGEIPMRNLLDHLDSSAAYACAELYLLNRQVSAMVKKYEFQDPKITNWFNPEHSAQETWLRSEESCARINRLFSTGQYLEDEALCASLFKMRTYISRIIGFKPDLREVYENCYFSAGASRGVGGDRTNLARKFLAEELTATARCRAHIVPALLASGLAREGLEVSNLDAPPLRDILARVRWVSGNKTSYVRKTIETHRPIAVEPLLNGYLQSGIDISLRRRLASRGVVDLRSQVPNQLAARHGSITGSVATIDLSSASDTIARELVRNLLSYEWWTLIDETRSHTTLTPSGEVYLEKCFSMGNNFCFPLQTLIFSAVCHASGASWFRVYGDDIVVDRKSAKTVCELLRALGFTPNPSKSFLEGPFRESCGADWLDGKPVRPVYAKKQWNDVRNIASFHNIALRVWPSNWHYILTDLRAGIPRASLFVRHLHTDDGSAFNVELDEAMASSTYSWDRNTQSWRWKEFHSTPVADSFEHPYYHYVECKARLRASGEEPLVKRRKTRTRVVLTHGRDLPPDLGRMPPTLLSSLEGLVV